MNVRHALSIVGALGLLAGTSLADTTAPFAQSFESPWVIGDPITASGGGGIVAPTAVPAQVLSGAGSRSLIVSNDTMTLDMRNSSYTNVWIQIYARPVKGGSDPTVTGATGAFYINGAGQVRARAGAGWTTIGSGFTATDRYYGFIVHANYETDTYDIYANGFDDGPGFKSTMTLLNSAPLAFISAGDTLDNVQVQSGDRAFVDAVAVSRAFQVPGRADSVEVYEHVATNRAAADFQMPAYSAAYTAPGSQKTLTGALGNDILSGLFTGDILKVYSANSWGYNEYGISAGNFTTTGFGTPGAEAPSSMSISTMTSLMLDQADVRPDTFGFYPYSNAVVVAVEGEIQSASPDVTEQFILNGTISQPQGWTALNWSAPSTDSAINSLPFNSTAQLKDGDFMFISLPGSPNAWTVYEWQESPEGAATGFWFKRIGSIPVDPIPAGANMWVKRGDEGHATVTIIH